MTRDFFPDAKRRQEAGTALSDVLYDTNGENDGIWLQEHLARRAPGAESILAADTLEGSSELPYDKLPRAMVDLFGNEIFAGRFGAELRDRILEKLLERREYRQIFHMRLGSARGADRAMAVRQKFASDRPSAAKAFVDDLKSHKRHPWLPGKRYAMSFVKELELDDAFAGVPSEPAPDRFEEVVPRSTVHDLKDFQKNMKAQILQILHGGAGKRAIVTLPTGAGKTRVVVDAVVDLLNQLGTDRNVLWIAQSQEVCEQAVLCFKQMWENLGEGETLNIFRAWGGNDIPGPEERGIIVGGAKKLLRHRKELHNLADDDVLSAVFIDEAHHSVAESYGEILKGLGMSPFPDGTSVNDGVPLIGLTATPERVDAHETAQLRRMYGHERIFPRPTFSPNSDGGIPFGGDWEHLGHMKEKLAELGYLSRTKFHLIDPGISEIHLTKPETDDFNKGGDVWLQKIATEAERNRNIKNEILEWAKKGKKILYFGTNVAQSNATARILEREGVRSVCITGDTRYAARRRLVDTFNKTVKGIQVMCNYNVLSTGFDSPAIDTVIIARPTTSIVSYQQMVGRGLRGTEFGGKESCDIVTVRDNIVKFNHERIDLAYHRVEQAAEPPGAAPDET